MGNSDKMRAFYTRPDVVDRYLDNRFASPAGYFHDFSEQQIIKNYLSKAKRVVEIACGPSRFGVVAQRLHWQYLGMDISSPMLYQAHQRWPAYSFVQMDAFALPVADQAVEAILTMRFIRHFTYPDRKKIYQEIYRVLQPGGWFVFDACNEARHRNRVDQRAVYDELYSESKLREELAGHHFKVHELTGYLYQENTLIRYLKGASRRLWRWGWRPLLNLVFRLHYRYERGSKNKKAAPYLWLVLCQKDAS